MYLRFQLVATAALLGLFSAWRLTAPDQIVAPILIACVGGLLLGVAHLARGRRSSGLAELEGWAVFPNGTFWVLPIAGALISPRGHGDRRPDQRRLRRAQRSLHPSDAP